MLMELSCLLDFGVSVVCILVLVVIQCLRIVLPISHIAPSKVGEVVVSIESCFQTDLDFAWSLL
jgi:hypothetical protein